MSEAELPLEVVRSKVAGFIQNHPECEYWQIVRELYLYGCQALLYQALDEMVKDRDVRMVGYQESYYVARFVWDSQPRLL